MHFREFCVFLHFAKLLPCFACCLRTGCDEKTFLLCLLRINFWYRKKKTTTSVEKIQRLRGCFLTTVYPTSATGTYGIGGNKSTKEDVFPSGKGRKCLSCQRIDIMPILALSCYFLCIQFHIVLQIYFSYDLNDNTTILRSVLKTSTHLQILIFQTVRPIGIWWS